jgi:hypothetical protein
MLKRLLIAALAGLLIGVPVHAQLLMTGAGQPKNGLLIAQTNYLLGALTPGDSDTRSGAIGGYYASTGVLTQASANTARFDYSYNGSAWVARGWLVEAAATNFVYSSVINTTTYWGQFQFTNTPNLATAPDNTSSMTLITDNTVASSSHIMYQNNPATVSTGTITCALFMQAGTMTYVQIECGAIGNAFAINVNTSNWTISATNIISGTGTYTSSTITEVGTYNSRPTYLVTLTGTQVGGASQGEVTISGAGANLTTFIPIYTGTTTNFYAWGAYGVQGSYVTSYIPTTTAGASRSADTAANVNWYNGTSGNYLMVESESEASPGTITRASYCNSGCTATSFSAPTAMWIRRICQYEPISAGATAAIAAAAQANGTPCT